MAQATVQATVRVTAREVAIAAIRVADPTMEARMLQLADDKGI